MRHTWVTLIAAVAAAAVFAPGARAQTPTLDARIGAFFAVDSTLRDLDNTWLAAGVDAHVPTVFAKNSDTVFSIDVITRDIGRSKSNVFPLLISEYFYFSYGPQKAYFGLGLGGYVADVGTVSKTVWGGKFVLGLKMNQDWFAEADYYLSDKFQSSLPAKMNGLALYLGYKF